MPDSRIPAKPPTAPRWRGATPKQPSSPAAAPADANAVDLTKDVWQLVQQQLGEPRDFLQFAAISRATRDASRDAAFRKYFRAQSRRTDGGALSPGAAAFVAAFAQEPRQIGGLLAGLAAVAARLHSGRAPRISGRDVDVDGDIRPDQVRWSRCGKFLSLGDAQTLHVIDVKNDRVMPTQLPSQNAPGVGWLAQPARLVVAHLQAGGGASAFDPSTQATTPLPLPAGTSVSRVDCAPRGPLVLCGGPQADDPVWVVDVEKNKPIATLHEGGRLLHSAWSTDGRYLALQWTHGATTVYAVGGDRSLRRCAQLETHPAKPLLEWSESARLAVAGPAGQLQTFAADGSPDHLGDPSQQTSGAIWSASAKALAESLPDGEVRLHQRDADDARGFSKSVSVKARGRKVRRLHLAPAAQALVYTTEQRALEAIDLAAPAPRPLARPGGATLREISPDGSLWVTLDADRTLTFQTLESQPQRQLRVPLGELAPAAQPSGSLWSPDATSFSLIYGRQIVTVHLTEDESRAARAARLRRQFEI